jgi:acyl carrier protein
MALSIIEKVREFLIGNLVTFEDDLELDDNDNFFELGFVDSSFAMQLVSFVEEEFNITVTNEDLDLANFSSISRIVQFIEKKKN